VLENFLFNLEKTGKMLNHFPKKEIESVIKQITPYMDNKYGEINLFKIRTYEILCREHELTKEINLIYWDVNELPWGIEKQITGLKIDIRYWPLSLDVCPDRGKHRGITLDNNYEIKKTIEAFENYINHR
jgi:hypothetical protein